MRRGSAASDCDISLSGDPAGFTDAAFGYLSGIEARHRSASMEVLHNEAQRAGAKASLPAAYNRQHQCGRRPRLELF